MKWPRENTTRVVLVRHGEPDASIRGRCYGRLDIGLSIQGRDQMRRSRELLGDALISSIYCSPSCRSLESADVFAAGAPVTVDDRFREIDFGEFEGLTYDDIAERFPEGYEEWMIRPTEVTFPGGECFAAMVARVRDGADYVRHSHQGQLVVIVSHGGVNRIVLADALDLQLHAIFRLDQTYACVNVIDYVGDEPFVRLINATLSPSC